MAPAETAGSSSAPNHRQLTSMTIPAASHAPSEYKAVSMFNCVPKSPAPFIVFLFALGIAFGAYVLVPFFLPQLALSQEDRLRAAAEVPLL
jgi:hypothetical protein